MKVVIAHDVLGTLFGFDKVIEELRSIHGDRLQDDAFAELVVMDWYHAAQRDFTTLSINGAYKPIAEVFKATLPRVIQQAKLAHTASTDEKMMASLKSLSPRPGMVQAFNEIYSDRSISCQVWGATNGSETLAKHLFTSALGQEKRILSGKDTEKSSSGDINLFSCDEIQIAKPDPRVYTELRKRISATQKDDSNLAIWFVASHTWDLFAARRAGFKTAWVSYEEFDPCNDIFGQPYITAKTVDECARKIIQHEKQQQQ